MHRPRLRPLYSSLLLLLLALPLGTTPALAAEEVGIDVATQWVKQEYGGKVLKVERLDDQDPPVYRFKVLQPSGRLKHVLIDARTGRPVAGQGKDRRD